MKNSTFCIRVLLAVGTALAAVATLRDLAGACGACTVGPTALLPLAGVALYGGLFAMSLVAGFTRLVFAGIVVAAAVHGVLVAHLVAAAQLCALCLAAAVNALGLVILSVAADSSSALRFSILFPAATAGAALVIAGTGLLRPPQRVAEARAFADATDGPNPTPEIRHALPIDIYEKPDCPYCVELRGTLVPLLEREFGDRIGIVYHDAAELPGLRFTPTTLIGDTDVIEGLPPYARLREAVERALAGRRTAR